MRHPKIRNPVVSWLLTLLTGGIYFLFWVWAVANELNVAEEREVFNVRRWRLQFLLLHGFAYLAVIIAVRTGVLSPAIFAVLCLIAFYISVQVVIGCYIKQKDRELGTGAAYSNGIFLVLFWCIANLGVAYMQAGINRIIISERSR